MVKLLDERSNSMFKSLKLGRKDIMGRAWG